MLFQLLSLFFGIHSLNTLSHQIAQFLSVTIWKLTFPDSLILPKFPFHLIICWWTLHCTWTMSLPNPSTRCATELDSFRGYWRKRSFVIIIIIAGYTLMYEESNLPTTRVTKSLSPETLSYTADRLMSHKFYTVTLFASTSVGSGLIRTAFVQTISPSPGICEAVNNYKLVFIILPYQYQIQLHKYVNQLKWTYFI